MNGRRPVVAGALSGLLAALVTTCAMAAVPGSAASLDVDGGVLQVFVVDDLPDLPLPGAPAPLPPGAVEVMVPGEQAAAVPVEPAPASSIPAGGPAPAVGSAEPPAAAEPEVIRYESCAAARDAGAAPFAAGDPNYLTDLDADGDAVACEADDPAG